MCRVGWGFRGQRGFKTCTLTALSSGNFGKVTVEVSRCFERKFVGLYGSSNHQVSSLIIAKKGTTSHDMIKGRLVDAQPWRTHDPSLKCFASEASAVGGVFTLSLQFFLSERTWELAHFQGIRYSMIGAMLYKKLQQKNTRDSFKRVESRFSKAGCDQRGMGRV